MKWVKIISLLSCFLVDRWVAGEIACDLWTFANIWFVVASLLNLCMVSWDRYVAVTSPFSYKLRMRGRKVRILIAIVWIVSLIIGVLYTLAFKFSKERRLCKASGLSKSSTISFFTVVYALPTLFLVFVNARVIIEARRHRQHIRAQEVTPSWITEGESDIEIKNDPRKAAFLNEVKTFKTFMVVIGTFVLCYSPFFILTIISRFHDMANHVIHAAVIFFYVKSALNPMIYGASKDLRAAAANSLKMRRRIETEETDTGKPTPKISVIEIPGQAPGQEPGHGLGHGPSQPSGHNLGQLPGHGSGQAPGHGLRHETGQASGQARVQSPVKIDDIVTKTN